MSNAPTTIFVKQRVLFLSNLYKLFYLVLVLPLNQVLYVSNVMSTAVGVASLYSSTTYNALHITTHFCWMLLDL